MKRRYLALFMAMVTTCSQILGTSSFVMAEEAVIEHVHDEVADEELELLSEEWTDNEIMELSADDSAEVLLPSVDDEEVILDADAELLPSEEESEDLTILDVEVIEPEEVPENESETESETESEMDTEIQTEYMTESETEVQSENVAESETEVQSETATELETEAVELPMQMLDLEVEMEAEVLLSGIEEVDTAEVDAMFQNEGDGEVSEKEESDAEPEGSDNETELVHFNHLRDQENGYTWVYTGETVGIELNQEELDALGEITSIDWYIGSYNENPAEGEDFYFDETEYVGFVVYDDNGEVQSIVSKMEEDVIPGVDIKGLQETDEISAWAFVNYVPAGSEEGTEPSCTIAHVDLDVRGYYVHDFEYGDRNMLPNWSYDLNTEFGLWLEDKTGDHEVRALITGLRVVEQVNYGNEGSDAVTFWPHENGWTIRAMDYGYAKMEMEWELKENNDISGTHPFIVWINGDDWRIELDTDSATNRILPGGELILSAEVIHECYEYERGHYRGTDEGTVLDFKVRGDAGEMITLENVTYTDEETGEDRTDPYQRIVKASNEVLEEGKEYKEIIEVRVYEWDEENGVIAVDEQGNRIEYAYTEYEVRVEEGFAYILPKNIQKDLYVGESIEDVVPELWLSATGMDSEQITENIRFRWSFDPEAVSISYSMDDEENPLSLEIVDDEASEFNGWSSQTTTDAVTITKLKNQDTEIRVRAERYNYNPENLEEYEIASEERGWWLWETDYGVEPAEGSLRGDGWSWIFTDENVAYGLNTDNLRGEYRVTWQAGIYDEESDAFVPFDTELTEQILTVDAEDSRWITICGNALTDPESGEILEAIRNNENWFHVRATVWAGDEDVSGDMRGIHVRETDIKYHYPIENQNALPGDKFDIEPTFRCNVTNGANPNGSDQFVSIIGIAPAIGSEELVSVEGDVESGWTIQVLKEGEAELILTYQLYGSNETDEYPFTLRIGSVVHGVDIWAEDGTDQLLPGHELTLNTHAWVRYYDAEEDRTYDGDREDLWVEFTLSGEDADKFEITRTWGSRCIVRAHDHAEPGQNVLVEVRVYNGDADEEGNLYEHAYNEFRIHVGNEFYNLYPVGINDQLGVNESETFTPYLRGGNTEEGYYDIGNAHYFLNWDPDALRVEYAVPVSELDGSDDGTGENAVEYHELTLGNDYWSTEPVTGEVKITKLRNQKTDLNVRAYLYNEETGEYSENDVASRGYTLNEVDYRVWFEELRGDQYTWIFEDEDTYRIHLNTDCLNDRDENAYRIVWEAGIWDGEAETLYVIKDDGLFLDPDNSGVTLNGPAFAANGQIRENGGHFDLRVRVVPGEGGNEQELFAEQIGADVVKPVFERYFPGDRTLLPGWDMRIESQYDGRAENAAYPNGEDIRFRIHDVYVNELNRPVDAEDDLFSCEREEDDQGNYWWTIRAESEQRGGQAEVTLVYEQEDSDAGRQEYRFILALNHNVYSVSIKSDSGRQELKAGETDTLTAYPWYKEFIGDGQIGYAPENVSYTWEVADGGDIVQLAPIDENNLDVFPEKRVITINENAEMNRRAEIKVTMYIQGEEGQDLQWAAEESFELWVKDSYYVVEPLTINADMEVGEVEEIQPVLKLYETVTDTENTGEPQPGAPEAAQNEAQGTPITESVRFRWSWDTDAVDLFYCEIPEDKTEPEKQIITPTPGEEWVEIPYETVYLRRIGDWANDIRIQADIWDAEKEDWSCVFERQYHLNEKNYRIWFEEEPRNPEEYYSWIYTDGEQIDISVNTSNLPKKTEDGTKVLADDCVIRWEVGPSDRFGKINDINNGYPKGEGKTGYTVSEDDTGITLDGSVLKELGFEHGNWISVRAVAYMNEIEVNRAEYGMEIRDPEYAYKYFNFDEEQQFLVGDEWYIDDYTFAPGFYADQSEPFGYGDDKDELDDLRFFISNVEIVESQPEPIEDDLKTTEDETRIVAEIQPVMNEDEPADTNPVGWNIQAHNVGYVQVKVSGQFMRGSVLESNTEDGGSDSDNGTEPKMEWQLVTEQDHYIDVYVSEYGTYIEPLHGTNRMLPNEELILNVIGFLNCWNREDGNYYQGNTDDIEIEWSADSESFGTYFDVAEIEWQGMSDADADDGIVRNSFKITPTKEAIAALGDTENDISEIAESVHFHTYRYGVNENEEETYDPVGNGMSYEVVLSESYRKLEPVELADSRDGYALAVGEWLMVTPVLNEYTQGSDEAVPVENVVYTWEFNPEQIAIGYKQQDENGESSEVWLGDDNFSVVEVQEFMLYMLCAEEIEVKLYADVYDTEAPNSDEPVESYERTWNIWPPEYAFGFEEEQLHGGDHSWVFTDQENTTLTMNLNEGLFDLEAYAGEDAPYAISVDWEIVNYNNDDDDSNDVFVYAGDPDGEGEEFTADDAVFTIREDEHQTGNTIDINVQNLISYFEFTKAEDPEAQDNFEVRAIVRVKDMKIASNDNIVYEEHYGVGYSLENPEDYYEYPGADVIFGDEIELGTTVGHFIRNEEYPHGEEHEMAITDMQVVRFEQCHRDETTGEDIWEKNPDVETRCEYDAENECWRLWAADFGRLVVDITHECFDSTKLHTERVGDFGFNGDKWHFDYWYQDETAQMLPNSEIRVWTGLDYEWLDGENCERERRENYYLEVCVDEFDTSVVDAYIEDDRTLVIQSNENTGKADIPVRVMIQEEDHAWELRREWFHVNVTDGYYVLWFDNAENGFEQKMTGEDFDIWMYDPAVYLLSTEFEEPQRQDNVRFELEYDQEQWMPAEAEEPADPDNTEIQAADTNPDDDPDVPEGSEPTDVVENEYPVLHRTGRDGNEIKLIAKMELPTEEEEGNISYDWQEVGYTNIGFEHIEYGSRIDRSYGDDGCSKVFTDTPLELTMNVDRDGVLPEGYEVNWIVEPHRDCGAVCVSWENKPFDTELTGEGTDETQQTDPHTLVLSGNEGHAEHWVNVKAQFTYCGTVLQESELDIEVRDPYYDYGFPESWQMLPHWEDGFWMGNENRDFEDAAEPGGSRFSYQIEDILVEAEGQVLEFNSWNAEEREDLGEDSVNYCRPDENGFYYFKAKHMGEATVTIYYVDSFSDEKKEYTFKAYVGGTHYELQGEYQNHADQVVPGASTAIMTSLFLREYDLDTDEQTDAPVEDYRLELISYDESLIIAAIDSEDGHKISIQAGEQCGGTDLEVAAYITDADGKETECVRTTYRINVSEDYAVIEPAELDEAYRQLTVGNVLSIEMLNPIVKRYNNENSSAEDGIVLDAEDVHFEWNQNSIDENVFAFDFDTQTLTRISNDETNVELIAYQGTSNDEWARIRYHFDRVEIKPVIRFSYGDEQHNVLYTDTPIEFTLNTEEWEDGFPEYYNVEWRTVQYNEHRDEYKAECVKQIKIDDGLRVTANKGCNGEWFDIVVNITYGSGDSKVSLGEYRTGLRIEDPIYTIFDYDREENFIVSETLNFVYDSEREGYPVTVYVQNALNPEGRNYEVLLTAITVDNQDIWSAEPEAGSAGDLTLTAVDGGSTDIVFTVSDDDAENAGIPSEIRMRTNVSHDAYSLKLWTEGSMADCQVLPGDELQVKMMLCHDQYIYDEDTQNSYIIPEDITDLYGKGFYVEVHDVNRDLIEWDQNDQNIIIRAKDERGESEMKVVVYRAADENEPESEPTYITETKILINVTGFYYGMTIETEEVFNLDPSDENAAVVLNPVVTRYSMTAPKGTETDFELNYLADYDINKLAFNEETLEVTASSNLELTKDDDPVNTEIRVEAWNADGDCIASAAANVILCVHRLDEEVIDPTCSNTGHDCAVCEKCEKVVVDEELPINPNAHAASSEWVITKASTCIAPGIKVQYCKYNCGTVMNTGTVDKLTHEAGSTWTTTKAATCTEAGTKVQYCKYNCRTIMNTGTVGKIVHAASDAWTTTKAATCTEAGTKVQYCKYNCGTVMNTGTVGKIAHEAGSTWTTTKAATCTEAGTKVQYCKYNCGTVVNTGTVDKIAHVANGTWTIAKEPTCTSTGTKVQYCKYDCKTAVDTQVIQATGHAAGSWSVTIAATCTTAGEKVQKCSVCKEQIDSAVLPATGHKLSDWTVTTTPTCTEDGVKMQLCTNVGCDHRVTEMIQATGHKMSDWKETAASTKSVPEEIRTCQNTGCDETEIRTMKLAATSLKLKKNQSTKAFKITDMAEGDSVVSVKTSKSSIFKVQKFTAGGSVTLKAAKSKTGSAYLTVTLKSGLERKIKVTVQKGKVTTKSVKLESKKITMKRKAKITLIPILNPITTQDKVTFKSKNKSIATVNSKGVVTAKKKGKTTITVQSGKKKATCTITVK